MVTYLSEVEVLIEFVDGLKKAAGSAHALGQYQSNPFWFSIRDKLEDLVVAGQKLASAKAIPRQQVLDELDKRLRELPKNG